MSIKVSCFLTIGDRDRSSRTIYVVSCWSHAIALASGKISFRSPSPRNVHPTGEHVYLPSNLTVKVLDGEGAAVMETHAKTANTHITLEFSAQLEERFSVRLELGNMSNTSNFVV